MTRFTPRADVAARRARVLAMRLEHIPDAEIAAELGIAPATVRSDYYRARVQFKAEQNANSHLTHSTELAKLDQMEQAVWKVLRARHVTVSGGKIVTDEDGETLLDDGPVLSAVDRLVKIAARRATLTGLDAPARIEVSDATDQAIRALEAELAAGRVADVEPGGEAAAAGDADQGA